MGFNTADIIRNYKVAKKLFPSDINAAIFLATFANKHEILLHSVFNATSEWKTKVQDLINQAPRNHEDKSFIDEAALEKQLNAFKDASLKQVAQQDQAIHKRLAVIGESSITSCVANKKSVLHRLLTDKDYQDYLGARAGIFFADTATFIMPHAFSLTESEKHAGKTSATRFANELRDALKTINQSQATGPVKIMTAASLCLSGNLEDDDNHWVYVECEATKTAADTFSIKAKIKDQLAGGTCAAGTHVAIAALKEAVHSIDANATVSYENNDHQKHDSVSCGDRVLREIDIASGCDTALTQFNTTNSKFAENARNAIAEKITQKASTVSLAAEATKPKTSKTYSSTCQFIQQLTTAERKANELMNKFLESEQGKNETLVNQYLGAFDKLFTTKEAQDVSIEDVEQVITASPKARL